MTAAMRQRVLVIEDNQDLAFGLSSNLQLEGYQVQVANAGQQGLVLIDQWCPALILLDVMLPDIDGFEVLRRLREARHQQPVLMLTARGEEADKVRGLRGGADDYLTKPFGLMELLARVERLLARAAGPRSDQDYHLGQLRVLSGARQVVHGERQIELSPKEFGLLLALLRRQGRVASRQQLMQEVWGHSGRVVSRTVDTHIAELRRKLEPDPRRPRYIITVRKSGYRIDAAQVIGEGD